MKLDRRHFLKSLTASAAIGSLPTAFRVYGAPEAYSGKLLMTVQAEGGFDVTSFCDPKVNVAGELEINRWARNRDPLNSGNIDYAPVAGNQAFFSRHYQDMLVINGIDAQTNSHTVGVTHNWSGRISAGYPSLTALFANAQAPNLPISYINNGGYSETAGVIRYTRLSEVQQLSNIIFPNRVPWNADESYLHQSDWSRIQQARQQRLSQLNEATNLTPGQQVNREGFRSALDNSAVLRDFASALRQAGDLESEVTGGDNQYSSLRRQAQIALLAMQSGVSVAADVIQWGFDTHANHDADQYWNLEQLTLGVDYIWRYAERLGLADRLVVVIASDFGRTPHYNDTEGKDHWPIGSAIVMERDVSWTNRTIGVTDGGHNALRLNPRTLQPSSNGELIHPKHLMYNLREYLGLNGDVASGAFPLNDAAAFQFFNV